MGTFDLLRAIVKTLTPGSLFFLIAGFMVGFGLLLAPRRFARWGRRWLILLVGFYAILSMQGTSDLLVSGLSVPYQAIRAPVDAANVSVIVVLSNGATDVAGTGGPRWVVNLQSGSNAFEGARLYGVLGDPLVIASGGRASSSPGPPESQALAADLEQRGVPAAQIVEESLSRTTREQAVNVGQMLRARGVTRFVLVTVAEHMRRADACFRVLGFDAVPSPSPLQYGGRPFWRPTFYALAGSKNAIHEYMALAFYKMRGWI